MITPPPVPGFHVLGHNETIQTLKQTFFADRLHHAYLFTGPEGVGKRIVAYALARMVNCLDDVSYDNAEPCNQCRSCLRIAAGNHADVREVAPDRSKARHIIKIEQIREVTKQVRFKPYEGRKRVILIDSAETLNIEAANAFLKTLEEPTGDTMFILVSHQPQQMLPTIRSRCQFLRFGALSRESVQSILQENGVAHERAQVASGFAQGSARRALDLCEGELLDERRDLIERLTALEPRDTLAQLDMASKLSGQSAATLQTLLESLKFFYRDVVFSQTQAHPSRQINTDLGDLVHEVAERLTVETAIGHIETISATQQGIRSYVDSRLLMERLVLQLAAS